MGLNKYILSIAFVVSLVMPSLAMACAVCFADPSEKMVQSLGVSVLFLLVTIAAVLLAFVVFFLRIRNRERKMDIPHGARVHVRDRHPSYRGV